MNSDKFRTKAYKESRNKLYAKVETGEELTKEEYKSYKRVKGFERRQRIQWQNVKIILILGLGLIIFGAITAASYKMSLFLGIVSLIVSLIITIIAYRANKNKQYFTFKYSKQLWYVNAFLGMSLIGGLGGIYNSNDSYSIYKNIVIIIYIFVILYIIVTSYIIYSAAHKNEDVISND